uniref:Uncharacterized protein n=1 Tax=Rangifer tarandus platyrhynchus TaxID=3082113 RepID=A0ACB0EWV8_RANTA|nr:unnamed protein product [Rangifer tarandus platyrhynchus]
MRAGTPAVILDLRERGLHCAQFARAPAAAASLDFRIGGRPGAEAESTPALQGFRDPGSVLGEGDAVQAAPSGIPREEGRGCKTAPLPPAPRGLRTGSQDAHTRAHARTLLPVPSPQPGIPQGKRPRDREAPEEAFVSCPDGEGAGMRSAGAAKDARQYGQP